MSLSDNITTISESLSDIRTAIVNKGVTPTGDITTYATAIGNITTLNGQTKTVSPTTSQQTVTPDNGYNGLTSVTVNAVTSAIDNNITAGNIKKDVTILGVTGSYEGSGGGANEYVFVLPNNVTDLDTTSQYSQAFLNNTTITGADLSGLTSVSVEYALYQAFKGCTHFNNVNLSSLESVSGAHSPMEEAFMGTALTSIDLSSLSGISGVSALASAFKNVTTLTTVDLSALSSIDEDNVFYSTFEGCTGLRSVTFTNLDTIMSSGAFDSCFKNCTNITVSFPALRWVGATTSESATSIFDNMFTGATNATVHFPSDMESYITDAGGLSIFGGTNTTVLFDLPASGFTPPEPDEEEPSEEEGE